MTRISAPALFRQFCLTLAHESTQPQFVADEWQFPEKSYVSGFQIIDSKLLISRENAHRGEILKTNEPVTLLITVYDQGFAISCDGKLIDEHTAGYHNVVRNGHYAIPDVRAIGIDADRCGFRITSLDLTPLVADSDSQHIWPVTADFRAAVWASVAPSDKGGELRGPILGRKKPIDGRPIWELSGQKFFVHSINVAGKKHVRDIGLKSLEGLSELNELNLSDTQVTDAGLVHLKGLTSLKKLDLSGTKITRAGYEILKAALPECEISWDSGKQSP